MLILSKYHDYYDTVAFSKGIDKSIVYKREKSQISYDKIKNNFPTHGYYWSRTDDKIFTFIIGFCGKLYTVAKKENKDNPHEIIYGYENVINLFKIDKKKNRFSWDWNTKKIENLNSTLNSKAIQDIFFEFKVPCFILGYQDIRSEHASLNLELNPDLKSLDFVKIIDPWTAFQEIEMFISGVIGTDKLESTEPTDKTKIISKGFDYKTSFRKEKKK